MSVLPLYIEIERPRPVFRTSLDHSNLLSGFVLPAILAAQRSRCQELQKRNSVSQEKAKADEGQAKSHFDVSGEQRLSQGLSQRYKFEVSLDVQHFSPEEISVKTADRCIVVEGKHEEKQDEHGYISRRYALPEGCHPDTVQSRLSSDGVLTVTAPWKQPAPAGERAVPITHTGPVRVTPSTSKHQKDVQE